MSNSAAIVTLDPFDSLPDEILSAIFQYLAQPEYNYDRGVIEATSVILMDYSEICNVCQRWNAISRGHDFPVTLAIVCGPVYSDISDLEDFWALHKERCTLIDLVLLDPSENAEHSDSARVSEVLGTCLRFSEMWRTAKLSFGYPVLPSPEVSAPHFGKLRSIELTVRHGLECLPYFTDLFQTKPGGDSGEPGPSAAPTLCRATLNMHGACVAFKLPWNKIKYLTLRMPYASQDIDSYVRRLFEEPTELQSVNLWGTLGVQIILPPSVTHLAVEQAELLNVCTVTSLAHLVVADTAASDLGLYSTTIIQFLGRCSSLTRLGLVDLFARPEGQEHLSRIIERIPDLEELSISIRDYHLNVVITMDSRKSIVTTSLVYRSSIMAQDSGIQATAAMSAIQYTSLVLEAYLSIQSSRLRTFELHLDIGHPSAWDITGAAYDNLMDVARRNGTIIRHPIGNI